MNQTSTVLEQSSTHWFSLDEFAQRLARCQQYMAERQLDYLVVFEPENVTYLTGFYTDGYYTSFQAAIVPATGAPLTILRRAELYYFHQTAAWPEHLSVWEDGTTPADAVLNAMDEIRISGRIGIEGGSWRAPYSLVSAITDARAGLRFVDVGKELFRLRFIKSEAEIEYHRAAARAADTMHEAAIAAIRPGVTEQELAIVASAAGIRAGSDVADPGPLACGERARHIHAYFSDGRVSNDDMVFLEMDASKRRYRSRSMRTVKVGVPQQRMLDAYARFDEIQREALATVRAGVSCRTPDEIIRRGVLETGWVTEYPNKTFYGMGFMLLPNSYEPLEVTRNADFQFETGMVFHAYISANGLNVSETIVITDNGYEQLTSFDRSLVVR